ncbi:MAG: HEPN domain-containing protein [Nitrospirae bacterium]|nr:HEPN domain-containing protein [Nitrospirota bacterium]
MDTNQHIDYWLKSAAHDLEAAGSLFQNHKYDWCLFIGQKNNFQRLRSYINGCCHR